MVTKIQQKIQGDPHFERNVFKCYCGEDSWFEITRDVEDGQIYLSLTKHPTRLKERLVWAWKALRGLEFATTNEVVIDGADVPQIVAALLAGVPSPVK